MRVVFEEPYPRQPESAPAAAGGPRAFDRLRLRVAGAHFALPTIPMLRLAAGACIMLGLLALVRASVRDAPPSILLAGGLLTLAGFAVLQLDRSRGRSRTRRQTRLLELRIRLKHVRRSLQAAQATVRLGSAHDWAAASTRQVDTAQEQMIQVLRLGAEDSRQLSALTSSFMNVFLELADRLYELAARPQSVVLFRDLSDAELATDTFDWLKTALDAMENLLRRTDEVG